MKGDYDNWNEADNNVYDSYSGRIDYDWNDDDNLDCSDYDYRNEADNYNDDYRNEYDD
jgi:hypothetical protein